MPNTFKWQILILSAPHCSLSSDIKSTCIYRDSFAARRCTPNGIIFKVTYVGDIKKIIPFAAVEDNIGSSRIL